MNLVLLTFVDANSRLRRVVAGTFPDIGAKKAINLNNLRSYHWNRSHADAPRIGTT